MKRALAIIAVLAIVIAGWLLIGSTGDEPYLVRGVFDNGAFVVKDEDVRVAGATVGSVESVDVSLPDEVVSEQEGLPDTNPGKAVVVMRIDDPRFQDWRTDASCLIRPQSLIGEKFIDCQPSRDRAPGAEPAPELTEISDDQPGAGQRLLPLENNGKTVDVDLINNIMRRPYAERLRLIINDLGAGLAGRGEDLREVIRRGNPVLRDAHKVLGQLAVQNKGLARLASDSDEILAPLARERERVSGFITNAGATAEVTAANGEDVSAAWQKFPAFLRELNSTMTQLRGFSDEAQPVLSDFEQAAPDLTTATRRFKPFASNSIKALKTLGDAGEQAAPVLNDSIPAINKTARLVQTGAKPLTDSASFLGSLRETKGFERLMDLIYNTSGAMNGFDSYGHYLRSAALPTNCTDYWPGTPISGCMALFGKNNGKSFAALAAEGRRARRNDEPQAKGGVGAPQPTAPVNAPALLDYLLSP